eukprot:1030521-Pleurochrysis_carterae.AAC.2
MTRYRSSPTATHSTSGHGSCGYGTKRMTYTSLEAAAHVPSQQWNSSATEHSGARIAKRTFRAPRRSTWRRRSRLWSYRFWQLTRTKTLKRN